MDQKRLVSQKFFISSHIGENGKLSAGYHCHTCGTFYATGRITIETATHVLGSGKTTSCCGKTYPLPLTFETQRDACGYIDAINANKTAGTRARLIAKSSLMLARFNPGAKPPGTTLH